MTTERIRASETTAVRRERTEVGEQIHVHGKKIGRILPGGDWRAREMGYSGKRRRPWIGYHRLSPSEHLFGFHAAAALS